MPEKLRRSSTLTLYWEKEGLVCEDYLTHERAALTPDLVDLLERFSKPAASERVIRNMGEKPAQVRQAIRQLLALGFLEKGVDAAEKRLARWHWGHAAKQYIFGTKDAHQFFPRPQRLAYAKRLMKESRQPALYKSYPDKAKTQLVSPAGFDSEANATLSRVRNCRDYSGRPISREALSEILFLTWGEQGKIHPDPWGTLLEKTSYSGGNRHPVEVYPIVVNVEGLASGLYHYNVRDHSLEILSRGDFSTIARRIGNRQEWIKRSRGPLPNDGHLGQDYVQVPPRIRFPHDLLRRGAPLAEHVRRCGWPRSWGLHHIRDQSLTRRRIPESKWIG